MSKKNWIYIKRGMSEDPKHRERIGMAIWLFMHMIDAADWETGRVYDWRDKEVGIDMTASTATVREWRQRLTDLGYITCVQKQHSLEIIIHNWNNPKEYNTPKINVRQGKSEVAPLDAIEIEGTPQGDNQGDNQVLDATRVNLTPFIESESISISISDEKPKSKISKESISSTVGLEWLIAGGASEKEVAALVENEKRVKTITDTYEKSMGFNPLDWSKMERLQRFLLTKSVEEIKKFAIWSMREYSTFTPAKARQYPNMVIDLWPQAFIQEHKQLSPYDLLAMDIEREKNGCTV